MEYNKEKFDDLINKMDDKTTVINLDGGTANGNVTINMTTDLSGDGIFIAMIKFDHMCGKLLFELGNGVPDEEDGDNKKTEDENEEEALKIQQVLETYDKLLIYIHMENTKIKEDLILSDKEALKQFRNKGGVIVLVLDHVNIGGKVKLYNDEANKLDFCKDEKICPVLKCPPQNVCEEDDDTLYIVVIVILVCIIILMAAGMGYIVNKNKK